MSAQFLEGAARAEQIKKQLKKELESLCAKVVPHIVAIAVGDNGGTEVYLKSQKRVADELGIRHTVKRLPDDAQQEEILSVIKQLNSDTSVHGIIVQMPLPDHLCAGTLCDAIMPVKDVEGMHADTLGRLVLERHVISPCTAQAALELIDATGIDLYGKEVVIVGASAIVGKPLALLLIERMATVTLCHIGTFKKQRLKEHVERAEVLVVAVGKPQVIPGEWIAEGSVVIDIGINAENGKLIGDVDFEGARERAAFITPVPGGVGPLTVTMLMRNCVAAFKRQVLGDS